MKKVFEDAQGRLLTEGYTHYWRNPQGFSDQQWKKLMAEAKKILAAAKKAGIKLAGPDGSGKPEIGDEYIAFNGVGEDSYEDCWISKNGGEFKFCKTAKKPYDPVVVSVLAAAKKINSKFYPSSDGGPEAIARIY